MGESREVAAGTAAEQKVLLPAEKLGQFLKEREEKEEPPEQFGALVQSAFSYFAARLTGVQTGQSDVDPQARQLADILLEATGETKDVAPAAVLVGLLQQLYSVENTPVIAAGLPSGTTRIAVIMGRGGLNETLQASGALDQPENIPRELSPKPITLQIANQVSESSRGWVANLLLEASDYMMKWGSLLPAQRNKFIARLVAQIDSLGKRIRQEKLGEETEDLPEEGVEMLSDEEEEEILAEKEETTEGEVRQDGSVLEPPESLDKPDVPRRKRRLRLPGIDLKGSSRGLQKRIRSVAQRGEVNLNTALRYNRFTRPLKPDNTDKAGFATTALLAIAAVTSTALLCRFASLDFAIKKAPAIATAASNAFAKAQEIAGYQTPTPVPPEVAKAQQELTIEQQKINDLQHGRYITYANGWQPEFFDITGNQDIPLFVKYSGRGWMSVFTSEKIPTDVTTEVGINMVKTDRQNALKAARSWLQLPVNADVSQYLNDPDKLVTKLKELKKPQAIIDLYQVKTPEDFAVWAKIYNWSFAQ